MHKFFTDNIDENVAYIENEDVKHIYKVLRLKGGETVEINDLNGTEYLGEIREVTKKLVTIDLKEKLEKNNESPVQVYLYQAMPKAAKMDLISQKATELGVREIVPYMSERVVVDDSKAAKKKDRWNKIILEACKQSKRSYIPQVRDVIEFEELITELKEEMDLVVVAYESKEDYGVKKLCKDLGDDMPKKIGVVIGPEGGFEVSEIERLEDEGAKIVTLGPRILRTETAGFTMISILTYELGDMGGTI